jgi:antitoxin PrlF
VSQAFKVRFLLRILTIEVEMLVTDKGQVTIPKHIRQAAGVAPGSEVTFSLEGSKIVITPVGTNVKEDRRAKLKEAAARVRGSLSAEFKELGADEIMSFIRGDEPVRTRARRGSR